MREAFYQLNYTTKLQMNINLQSTIIVTVILTQLTIRYACFKEQPFGIHRQIPTEREGFEPSEEYTSSEV